jgi:cytidyltransferase-like protein
MRREAQQLLELHGTQNIDAICAELQKKKPYGLIIGRFQPIHFGHQHIINEIMLDGLNPIVVMGTPENGEQNEKNPLSFEQRMELFQEIFPNVNIKYLQNYDNKNWDLWFSNLLAKLKLITNIENITLYYYNKEEDRYSEFEVGGKRYFNTFYTDIFRDHDFKMKRVEFADRTDIHIGAHATSIREDLEEFKHLLDARVYRKLKMWGW